MQRSAKYDMPGGQHGPQSFRAWGRVSVVGILDSKPLEPGSIPGAAKLDGSFILATSAIHLITVVLACLLGLT